MNMKHLTADFAESLLRLQREAGTGEQALREITESILAFAEWPGKEERNRAMNEVYEVNIGNSYFYYHGPCLDKAALRNVNNRTPEEQEADREFFTRVPVEQVPDTVCSYCHRPIEEGADGADTAV